MDDETGNVTSGPIDRHTGQRSVFPGIDSRLISATRRAVKAVPLDASEYLVSVMSEAKTRPGFTTMALPSVKPKGRRALRSYEDADPPMKERSPDISSAEPRSDLVKNNVSIHQSRHMALPDPLPSIFISPEWRKIFLARFEKSCAAYRADCAVILNDREIISRDIGETIDKTSQNTGESRDIVGNNSQGENTSGPINTLSIEQDTSKQINAVSINIASFDTAASDNGSIGPFPTTLRNWRLFLINHEPSPAIVRSISYVDTIRLFNYYKKWVSLSMQTQLESWLYALLVKLPAVLCAEDLSVVRELAKRAVRILHKVQEEDPPLEVRDSTKLILSAIVIVCVDIYSQRDLLS